jgi:hypothetical protein
MQRIRFAVAAACAAVLGCGGSDGGSSNAAAGKTFTYGATTTAGAAERSAVQAPLASAASAGASGAALGLASFGNTTTSLLGSPGIAYLRASGSPPKFEEGSPRNRLSAGCLTQSGNTVTYKNCQESFDFGDFHGTETFDGNISLSSDLSSASWDLTARLELSSGQSTEKGRVHLSGSVTAATNHMRGHLLQEFTGSVSTGTTAASVSGFDEEVIFDLTYQTRPFCITSGTFETKRVWTQQSGQAAQTDKAVKMVFTGCNVATIAHSL